MKISYNLEGREYIQLNQLLKITNLVSSGGEANLMIDEGQVIVDGQAEFRRRNKVRAGSMVEFGGKTIEVK